MKSTDLTGISLHLYLSTRDIPRGWCDDSTASGNLVLGECLYVLLTFDLWNALIHKEDDNYENSRRCWDNMLPSQVQCSKTAKVLRLGWTFRRCFHCDSVSKCYTGDWRWFDVRSLLTPKRKSQWRNAWRPPSASQVINCVWPKHQTCSSTQAQTTRKSGVSSLIPTLLCTRSLRTSFLTGLVIFSVRWCARICGLRAGIPIFNHGKGTSLAAVMIAALKGAAADVIGIRVLLFISRAHGKPLHMQASLTSLLWSMGLTCFLQQIQIMILLI